MKAKHRVPKMTPELETMDTRVVPSVVGLGHGLRARAALAHHAFRNTAAMPAFQTMLSGHARVNPLTMQSPSRSLFSGRANFPTSFGGTAFGNATLLRQSAMLNVARPAPQVVNAVVVPSSSTQASAAAQTSAATNIADVKNGPLAKAGQDLIAVYQAFGPSGSGHLTSGASVEIVGSSVGVQVRTSGDVSALAATLSGMGMQIRGTDPNTHIVAGLLPISQLPNVAQLSQVTSIIPITKPMHGGPMQ